MKGFCKSFCQPEFKVGCWGHMQPEFHHKFVQESGSWLLFHHQYYQLMEWHSRGSLQKGLNYIIIVNSPKIGSIRSSLFGHILKSIEVPMCKLSFRLLLIYLSIVCKNWSWKRKKHNVNHKKVHEFAI